MVVKGHDGHRFGGLRRAHWAPTRRPSSDPSWACSGGVSAARQAGRSNGLALAVRGLRTSSRASPQTSHGRVAIGPYWNLGNNYFRLARRGAEGRPATLCDSRLRHAVKPVDSETRAWRRSGGVPDREAVLGAGDRGSAGPGDRSHEAETAAFEPDARLCQARFAASRALPRGPLGARRAVKTCFQRR